MSHHHWHGGRPDERMVSVRRSPLAEDSTRAREAIADGIGVKSMHAPGPKREDRAAGAAVHKMRVKQAMAGPTRLSGGAATTHTLARQ